MRATWKREIVFENSVIGFLVSRLNGQSYTKFIEIPNEEVGFIVI